MKIVRAALPNGNTSRHSERGQALVEYLLVLVVGITLVALLRQVYQPFGAFLDVYFGDYLECLLEAGELPGTAGGVCSEIYEAAAGQFKANAKTGPVNLRSNSGGSSDQSAKSKGRSEKSASAPTSQSSASKSREASGRGEGGQPLETNAGGRQRVVGRSTARDRGGGKEEKAYTGSDAVSSANFGNGRGSGGRGNRQPYVGVLGEIKDQRTREERTVASLSRASGRDDGSSLRPRRMPDTFKARKKTETNEDTSFSVGFAIRFLLIAAIIIAIILLIGGQLMQINRETD